MYSIVYYTILYYNILYCTMLILYYAYSIEQHSIAKYRKNMDTYQCTRPSVAPPTVR